MFLEIQGLRKIFIDGEGNEAGLAQLDLTIAEGEGFSLLGPSGCGKTTTLRLLGGFETPDAGTIRLHGKDLLKVAPHKRPIRTVFQKYALFPHLSVFENIVFSLRMSKKSEKEIKEASDEILELTQTRHLLMRPIGMLSGGEQQRVALARALISDPEILLLDEPLSALDLKLREKMQMELLRLRKKLGSSFVFVTHDQSEAMVLSDRIGVMNKGRLVQIGSPQEIYRRPNCHFVATFIGMANFFGTALGSHMRGNLSLLPEKTQDATWMLRPESIDLRSPGSAIKDNELGVNVRVIDTAFMGQEWLTKVQDPTGGTHLIKTPGHEPFPGEDGTELLMKWEYDDTWSVRNENSPA
ncbi:MAG: ABC transporter ATP-binding protein [Bdellovibrionota bacterium]